MSEEFEKSDTLETLAVGKMQRLLDADVYFLLGYIELDTPHDASQVGKLFQLGKKKIKMILQEKQVLRNIESDILPSLGEVISFDELIVLRDVDLSGAFEQVEKETVFSVTMMRLLIAFGKVMAQELVDKGESVYESTELLQGDGLVGYTGARTK